MLQELANTYNNCKMITLRTKTCDQLYKSDTQSDPEDHLFDQKACQQKIQSFIRWNYSQVCVCFKYFY